MTYKDMSFLLFKCRTKRPFAESLCNLADSYFHMKIVKGQSNCIALQYA